MQKIHKGDIVMMRSGVDRKKTGKVLRVLPRTGKVIVEGLNLITAHRKPKRQGERGQKLQFPRKVALSSVMLRCPQCKAQSRVGFRAVLDGRKERYCHKCKATIGRA